jgi:hypothetical protein
LYCLSFLVELKLLFPLEFADIEEEEELLIEDIEFIDEPDEKPKYVSSRITFLWRE